MTDWDFAERRAWEEVGEGLKRKFDRLKNVVLDYKASLIAASKRKTNEFCGDR